MLHHIQSGSKNNHSFTQCLESDPKLYPKQMKDSNYLPKNCICIPLAIFHCTEWIETWVGLQPTLERKFISREQADLFLDTNNVTTNTRCPDRVFTNISFLIFMFAWCCVFSDQSIGGIGICYLLTFNLEIIWFQYGLVALSKETDLYTVTDSDSVLGMPAKVDAEYILPLFNEDILKIKI